MPEARHLSDGIVGLRPAAEADVARIEQAGAALPPDAGPSDGVTLRTGLAFLRGERESAGLVIADAASDAALGLVFLPVRPQSGVVGIAYWMVPSARGRGLGTRAVRLAAEWALAQPETVRVEAWVEPGNLASQRVLASAGFAREGVLRSFIDFGDRRADAVVFSRVKRRIFLAGATGVLGVRLVPLLVAAGHVVAGMTRSAGRTAELERLGAQPVVCDVYDRPALRDAVRAFAPDAVMHQLTDLPDDAARMGEYRARNDRMRSEGTRNLVDAAGPARVYAQSIAWAVPPERAGTIAAHERMVLDAGGVILRYGQLYGPGTYYESDPPEAPRIGVDAAAQRTVALLDADTGIYELAEDG